MELLFANNDFIPYTGMIMSNGVSRIRQDPLQPPLAYSPDARLSFLPISTKVSASPKNDPHPKCALGGLGKTNKRKIACLKN